VIRAAAIGALLCLPLPAAADGHRQAVLQLVSIGAALREEARSVQHKGMLGIDVQSRMAAPECAEFFQDVASMRNLQAVRADGGDLVLRWHGKRELLLRMQRDPALALEVHDSSGPRPACSVRSVGAGDWKGKLTPLLLEFPGMTQKPQVFPVDPLRSPSRAALK
jgi:hypothetical protein